MKEIIREIGVLLFEPWDAGQSLEIWCYSPAAWMADLWVTLTT